jgi:hypothetical protein
VEKYFESGTNSLILMMQGIESKGLTVEKYGAL